MTVFSQRALFGLFFRVFYFLEKKNIFIFFFSQKPKIQNEPANKKGRKKKKSVFFPSLSFVECNLEMLWARSKILIAKSHFCVQAIQNRTLFSIISNLLFLPFYRK